MTSTVVTPFRFFPLHVLRSAWLGPAMVRVTFGGTLAGFASGGRDQRIKLFLPQPHQRQPVVPADAGEQWFRRWQAMDPAVRAVMRTYTVREQRRHPNEVDIDFAVHGGGIAGRWAAGARPGDRVVVLGPAEPDNAGIDFRPPTETDWVLLAGDETALPAMEGILRWLGPDTPVRAFVQIGQAADIRPLTSAPAVEVTWLIRDRGADPLTALRAAHLPPGRPYAWLAGESGMVRALRTHLLTERGLPRDAIAFTGYWRRGAPEDTLLPT